MELKQIFSAHTVSVEAVGDDGYHHVWVYTVSPTGRVLAESHVRVPIPNSSRWGWPRREKGRFLDGLPRTRSSHPRFTPSFLDRKPAESRQNLISH